MEARNRVADQTESNGTHGNWISVSGTRSVYARPQFRESLPVAFQPNEYSLLAVSKQAELRILGASRGETF